MANKELVLNFSTNRPTNNINCNKILFRKMQMLKGNIENINIELEYTSKNFSIEKNDISLGGSQDLYKRNTNNIYEFIINDLRNNWHDLTNAIGDIKITALHIHKSIESVMQEDFEFILFVDVI